MLTPEDGGNRFQNIGNYLEDNVASCPTKYIVIFVVTAMTNFIKPKNGN
jgi:hypothetical protein